jgi:hypothetical protein
MESLVVECLRCGTTRQARPAEPEGRLGMQRTLGSVSDGRTGKARTTSLAGAAKSAPRSPLRHDQPECPRCGYVGWAPIDALSERERRVLRERPLERRRLRLA